MEKLLTVNGKILQKAIIAGANELGANKDYINSLNVFPVPDGDTGQNMSMTAHSAATQAKNAPDDDIWVVAKAASDGALRGARGNSGVILSQLFRGFLKGVEGKSEINAKELAEAFVKAKEAAYKAVMKPKEGTILTIARAIADTAVEFSAEEDDIKALLAKIIEESHKILLKTEFMLPELKEAKVFDAGGRGLLYILEGALKSADIQGDITLQAQSEAQATNITTAAISGDIQFAYCTETLINLRPNIDPKKVEAPLIRFLDKLGDSVVVVSDSDIVKIHVHTNNPGRVLEKCITLGALDNIKIENMKLQNEQMAANMPQKDVGFIAVSAGAGFKEAFKTLGTTYIIEGGQTMNPSTENFTSAIEKINAKDIIILPNNKNIILAAQQAADLTEGKNVHVLATKSVVEGISAMVAYVESFSLETNIAAMQENIQNTQTGEITFSIKDTQIAGKNVKKGDILSMLNGKIVNVDKTVAKSAKTLIDTMVKEQEPEIISIYYGKDLKDKDAKALLAYVEKKYKDIDVELHNGGQALYYYIIAAE